jgi:hypothetical protein
VVENEDGPPWVRLEGEGKEEVGPAAKPANWFKTERVLGLGGAKEWMSPGSGKLLGLFAF